jgi:ABC-type multidrug transport system fused ATPase/permease subunit
MNRPFDDMPPTQDPVNHDDDPRSDVRIILDLLWRLRSASVAVFALMLAVALLEGLSVGLFMPLVASITGAETFAGGRIATMAANLIASVPPDSRLTVFGAAFVGLLAVKGAMTVAQVNVSYRFIYSIRQHWVERILRHYLDGSLLFMRTQSQGQLVNDLVQETFRSVRAVLDALNLASRTVTIGLLVVLMVLVDWRVTVIAAATGAGAYAATSGIVRRYSRELGRRLLDLNRRIQTGAIQALAGLREIKLYGVQDRTVHRFSSDIADSHRVQTVTHT